VVEESGVLPLPATAAAVEDERAAVEMTTAQASLEPLVGAGSGGADVVMVPSDEDSAPPPPSGEQDVVMTLVPEPSPAVKVPESSPAARVPEPSPAMDAAETSSDAVTVIVKEAMELATCRYVDFLGIGVIDLDAPSSRAMTGDAGGGDGADVHRSVHLGDDRIGFAGATPVRVCWRLYSPPPVSEAAKAVPKEFTTDTESVAVVSALPPTSEKQEAPLPQPAEAAEPTTAAAAAGATESVIGEAGSSSPRSVAAGTGEVIVPDEPAAALQEHVTPEDTARAASPEIQEAEEGTGAALLQGAAGGEAQTLELSCTS
jgi:hypothetical protein